MVACVGRLTRHSVNFGRFSGHPRARAHADINRNIMTVQKTEAFIADVERQFEWYARNVSWEVAEGYLRAVEESCLLLGKHPQLGPLGDFAHPRLSTWRFLSCYALLK